MRVPYCISPSWRRGSGRGRGLCSGQRILGRCLALVRVRVAAREKCLCCALDRLPRPILVKTTATKPRHKTSWCVQLLELRAGAELQAGQMPDELSVFPVADATT